MSASTADCGCETPNEDDPGYTRERYSCQRAIWWLQTTHYGGDKACLDKGSWTARDSNRTVDDGGVVLLSAASDSEAAWLVIPWLYIVDCCGDEAAIGVCRIFERLWSWPSTMVKAA